MSQNPLWFNSNLLTFLSFLCRVDGSCEELTPLVYSDSQKPPSWVLLVVVYSNQWYSLCSYLRVSDQVRKLHELKLAKLIL